MANTLTKEQVKEFAVMAGASVVGIASSEDFGLAPEGFRPTDVLEGCRSVIVLGTPFPREAILDDSVEYIDIRNEVNRKINDVAAKVGKFIKKEGYKKTKVVKGIGGKWVEGQSFGHISLKHAAELAGLGVIGRNYLLINATYGTLLWFSAVLTEAEWIPDEKIRNTFCSDCNLCVEMCPSGALDDPSSFGKKACSNTCFAFEDKKWKIKCFLCRKVCPHCFDYKKA